MTLTSDTTGTPDELFLRRKMPIVQRFAYFDNAAVSPVPEPTRQVMTAFAEQACFDGDTRWPEWSQGVETARRRAAELLTCRTEEIALVPNTTFGINLVANGLRWRPGDNLVVPANEFLSNLLPWRLLAARGVEVRCIEGEDDALIAKLLEAVDAKTRLTALSWVHYLTGYRADLASICEAVHAKGSLFMVDAIQGLGAFPLSLSEIPIDFLAADGHKWMLGPEGAGLFFARESRLNELDPIMMGWGSVRNSHHFDPKAAELKLTAARYEGGSHNMSGLLGFSQSLHLLLEAGCHRPDSTLAARIIELTGRLTHDLTKLGAVVDRHPSCDRQSGIVSFTLPGIESSVVRARLLRENVVLSVRHGRLRAAVHAYNDVSEIDRLLHLLEIE